MGDYLKHIDPNWRGEYHERKMLRSDIQMHIRRLERFIEAMWEDTEIPLAEIMYWKGQLEILEEWRDYLDEWMAEVREVSDPENSPFYDPLRSSE